MKKTFYPAALMAVIALVASIAVHAAAPNWDIDPVHSVASFSVEHMGISHVRGEFTKVTGTGYFDGKDMAGASVEATIDVSTINTREPKRDGHLKSPDFFDVEKYPTITFKSKRFKPKGNGKFTLVGDLTMHGVTKTVVLDGTASQPVKDPQGHERIGASASVTVHRKDYGLTWNKSLDNGGLMVGDDVDITLDLEFVKKP